MALKEYGVLKWGQRQGLVEKIGTLLESIDLEELSAHPTL